MAQKDTPSKLHLARGAIVLDSAGRDLVHTQKKNQARWAGIVSQLCIGNNMNCVCQPY